MFLSGNNCSHADFIRKLDCNAQPCSLFFQFEPVNSFHAEQCNPFGQDGVWNLLEEWASLFIFIAHHQTWEIHTYLSEMTKMIIKLVRVKPTWINWNAVKFANDQVIWSCCFFFLSDVVYHQNINLDNRSSVLEIERSKHKCLLIAYCTFEARSDYTVLHASMWDKLLTSQPSINCLQLVRPM